MAEIAKPGFADSEPSSIRNSMILREVGRRSPSIHEHPFSPTRSFEAAISENNDHHTWSCRTSDFAKPSTRGTEHPTEAKLTPLSSNPLFGTLENKKDKQTIDSLPFAELPATPVVENQTRATVLERQEERSLFEDDSSGDELEASSPKLARTDRPTAVRPKLVETKSSSSVITHVLRNDSKHQSPPTSPGTTRQKAAQVLGIEDTFMGMASMSPTKQESFNLPSKTNSLSSKSPPTAAIPPSEREQSVPRHSVDNDSEAFVTKSQTPPSPQLSFVPSSIIEVPVTPLRILGLETLPSPMGGLGTLRGVHTPITNYNIDGLRSNPTTDTVLAPNAVLQRTLSAPPLPFRRSDGTGNVVFIDPQGYGSNRSKRLNRKVTVRPTDIKAIDVAHANGLRGAVTPRLGFGQHGPSKGWFRENIVSTPYPTRATSVAQSYSIGLDTPETDYTERMMTGGTIKSEHTIPRGSQLTGNERSTVLDQERDGSIPTHLSPRNAGIKSIFVDLAIAGHPNRTSRIQIMGMDRLTCDDEQVFNQIRLGYKSLVGLFRYYLSARKLTQITINDGGPADRSFDEHDLNPCFSNPSLGRRRKTFLKLLQRHQKQQLCQSVHNSSPTITRAELHPASANADSATPALEPETASPNRPAAPQGVSNKNNSTATTTSANLSHSAADNESFHSAPATTTTTTTTTSHPPTQPAPSTLTPKPRIPTLTFHHTFSPLRLLPPTILLLLVSSLTTILWIIFGVPGQTPYSRQPTVDPVFEPDRSSSRTWHTDAGRRVTPGVLMGLMVLFLGLVGEGVWVWGSWRVM